MNDLEYLELIRAAVAKRWKCSLLLLLKSGSKRFSDMQNELTGIGVSVLSKILREHLACGLIKRTVIDTTPIQVSYRLTKFAKSFLEAYEPLRSWSCEYSKTLCDDYFDGLFYRKNVLKGKWMVSIVWLLSDKPMRLSGLQRELAGVSLPNVSRALREAVQCKLVTRTVITDALSVLIEYGLTDAGAALVLSLAKLVEWARDNEIESKWGYYQKKNIL